MQRIRDRTLSKESFVLQMDGIGKEYYGNRVLNDISLAIRPGEIHGIVGENGAGKSTLMNILFGMAVIHSTGGHDGTIKIDGKPSHISSPLQAMQLGIGMVHQEFMLIPGYSITENIKLNREITKDNIFSRFAGERVKTLNVEAMQKDARKSLDTLNMNIEEWAVVSGLPVGHKQFIEIARELDKTNLKLLVFDEPTAVLTESEADRLLDAMKHIAQAGIAILFITHRLHEIIEVCDTITVLRDGHLVVQKEKENTDIYELAEMMVGSRITDVTREIPDISAKSTILSVKNLQVDMPGESVKGVDLEVKEGEILGIGGLAGHGKLGISNGVMGLYDSTGTVMFRGTPVTLNNPFSVINQGLAFVSEDRRGVGLLLNSSIELNIVFSAIQAHNEFVIKRGPFSQMDDKAIRAYARKMIKDLDIRCTGPQQPTRRLSGGNQQKVCIARALALKPKLLFVSEPTRGIDIGAKKLVLETLVRLNKEFGMTVVMTSSELAELRSICGRIAIVTEGKIAGVLKPTDSDVDFGLMMAGEINAAG